MDVIDNSVDRIIDFMRDACRQLAHDREFLRLKELLAQAAQFRDVAENGGHAAGFFVDVVELEQGHVDRRLVPILGFDDDAVKVSRNAGLHDLVEWAGGFAVGAFQEVTARFVEDFVQAVTGDPFCCLVESDDLFIEVGDEHAAFHVLEQSLE